LTVSDSFNTSSGIKYNTVQESVVLLLHKTDSETQRKTQVAEHRLFPSHNAFLQTEKTSITTVR